MVFSAEGTQLKTMVPISQDLSITDSSAKNIPDPSLTGCSQVPVGLLWIHDFIIIIICGFMIAVVGLSLEAGISQPFPCPLTQTCFLPPLLQCPRSLRRLNPWWSCILSTLGSCELHADTICAARSIKWKQENAMAGLQWKKARKGSYCPKIPYGRNGCRMEILGYPVRIPLYPLLHSTFLGGNVTDTHQYPYRQWNMPLFLTSYLLWTIPPFWYVF